MRGGDQDLRAHLIATAAAVIARRGTAGLSVREIAKEAKVADGVLYNYFDGKDDLIAHGLRAHVHAVLRAGAPAPVPGSATVEANLVTLFTQAVTLLGRVMPAFAGTIGQPAVLQRFRDLISQHAGPHMLGLMGTGDAGLPQLFAAYLRAEQDLGRVAADADLEAVTTLLIGAAHDLVLPQVFLGTPGAHGPVRELPDGHAERIVRALFHGLHTAEG
ncbi:TetR/AcrR family transcriptional regulator [Catenulispora yoronensis]|uniref:TetR/AcrR family transcriptional regulator n=1 Tax=Catenulispora yoronensis TaxID=450799 RepID=A0ABN2TYR1_9ACTN